MKEEKVLWTKNTDHLKGLIDARSGIYRIKYLGKVLARNVIIKNCLSE